MRFPNPDDPICDCDHLWKCAKEPENPIVFDDEMNEFQLRYSNHSMMIYYCHFCGGRAPSESKRSSFFTEPTQTEKLRLIQLTKDIKTLEETLRTFGPPDHDFPSGESHTKPSTEKEPESTVSFRNLVYSRLSDTAEVRVRVYPTDKVQFRFESKYIGPKKS